MCVLDNNNGRNDTPQLSQSTKYDKLILTSHLQHLTNLASQPVLAQTSQWEKLNKQTNKLTLQCLPLLSVRQNDTLMAFLQTRSNTQDIFITKQDGILRRNTKQKHPYLEVG